MPIKPLSIYTQFHNSDHFSLRLKHAKNKTKLIMDIKNNIINTYELPHTVSILKNELPSIFESTCYNDFKYPFYKEVLRTEIGHLFEHILIENFCIIKLNYGFNDAEYTGVTKWNWYIYPKGSFHITISAGLKDIKFLSEAMSKSIALITQILASNNQLENINPAILMGNKNLKLEPTAIFLE